MTRKLAIIALGAVSVAAPALLTQAGGGQQAPPAQNPPAQAPPPAAPGPGQQPGGAPGAQGQREGPLSQLNLTDQQKKEIHKIRQQAEEKVQAIRKDTSLTQQQQMVQIRQVRRKQREEVEAVLTPEQREQYEAWLKEHARRRRPQQQPQQQPG